ncbi:universal stress protein [Pseudenhygromyxa sp. WMMC2535]|uniref:universal stress protein n=1 Tax=Pseudenhygromyxa sp. WMMC2535 TaxID=2712867 RepID=UPI00155633F0|nr:universal stress protein [Pseudenhygromyxa sp. WMMC2535]NVB40828.1 universal stress protein [Pseudenhygromyxa sp. WMMC2535]
MTSRIERIHLADDGSEHATWMLHYALRMARQLPEPQVQILHVREAGEADPEPRRERLQTLAARHQVELRYRELAPRERISASLADALRPGLEDIVLVGFRAHRRGRGLAFGTVGQALLARHDHSVLAMRIVEPGLMGLPKVLAAGLSDSPELCARLAPALGLFTPDLHELWLLRVLEVQRRFLGHLSFERLSTLEGEALAQLTRDVEQLRARLPVEPPRVERHVAVSDHWPSQLVMSAHRVRAHLLLLGASDHLLPARFSLSNPLEAVLHNAACDVAVFRKGVG